MYGPSVESKISDKLLSKESLSWTRKALDPFPDVPVSNFLGAPGINSSPNVLYHVKQQTVIQAPPQAGTGNYDAAVYISPVLWQSRPISGAYPSFTVPGRYYATPGNSAVAPGTGFVAGDFVDRTGGAGSRFRMDGLVVSTGATNDPLFTSGGPVALGLNMDQYYDKTTDSSNLRSIRICYSGFEVVNSTPVIQQGGSVTVFDSSDAKQERWFEQKSYSSGNPGTFEIAAVGVSSMYRLPPTTIAAAQQCPRASTWNAADGCYVAAKFTELPAYNDVTAGDYIFTYNSVDEFASTTTPTSLINIGAGSVLQVLGVPPIIGTPIRPATIHHSHNAPGAFFSALPNATTLTVVWNIGYEMLPSANDLANLALARQPALYDGMAFEFYCAVCAHLPVGVPRDYNDLGEWFRMVSDAMVKALPQVFHFLPILGGAMGGPLGLAVSAVGAAGTAINHAVKSANTIPKAEAQARAAQSARDKAAQSVATRVIKNAVAKRKGKK